MIITIILIILLIVIIIITAIITTLITTITIVMTKTQAQPAGIRCMRHKSAPSRQACLEHLVIATVKNTSKYVKTPAFQIGC